MGAPLAALSSAFVRDPRTVLLREYSWRRLLLRCRRVAVGLGQQFTERARRWPLATPVASATPDS